MLTLVVNRDQSQKLMPWLERFLDHQDIYAHVPGLDNKATQSFNYIVIKFGSFNNIKVSKALAN